MAKTLQDVVTSSRRMLQDSRTPYRYTDEHLTALVNEALSEARRMRPDLFIDQYTTAYPDYDVSDLGTAIPIDEAYFTALTHYVAGTAELVDDEFTVDGRATALITSFRTKLLSAST